MGKRARHQRPRPAERGATPSRPTRARRNARQEAPWLAAAIALPAILCASKLGLDLWYDEAFTLQMFVSRGLGVIATDYSAPNNHVFYSMVLRPFYLISQSDGVLRLPGFLFSIGTLAVTYRLGRALISRGAGVLAAFTLGLTQMFLIHTMQLRGYGLSMFLGSLLGALAMRRPGPGSRWVSPAIVLFGACFLYTMPTNLFFFVPVACLAVARETLRTRTMRGAIAEAARWGAAAALAFLLYLPILKELMKQQETPASWLAGVPLFREVFSAATRDARPIWFVLPLGLVFWFLRVRRSATPDRFWPPVFVLAMGVGPFILASLLRILPFPRNFCPALPYLALAAGWLLWEIADGARRLARPSTPESVAILVAMAALAAVVLPRLAAYPARLSEYRDRVFAQDAYYVYYAARFHPSTVVKYLRETIPPDDNYAIAWDRAGNFNLDHYFQRAQFPPARVSAAPAGEAQASVFYIAPALANYADLSAHLRLTEKQLREFVLVRDFGYYRLYRSPRPVTLRVGSPNGQ